MVRKVKSIIISGLGTNCERETAYCCRVGGAEVVDIVHIHDILYGEKRLDDYHLLNLAGGFLDGDDLGEARAGANRFKYASIKGTDEKLKDQLLRFIEDGKLIFGVCNGFQLMIKLGMLPATCGEYFDQVCTITYNDSGRFEDRWVYLNVDTESPCVFTKGIGRLYLPVRHGEGKFIPKDDHVYDELNKQKLVVMRYADEHFQPTMRYPENPNGSIHAIAGICNETGRLFGLMPHPEAFNHTTNHPRWTRGICPETPLGVELFKNGIAYIRENL